MIDFYGGTISHELRFQPLSLLKRMEGRIGHSKFLIRAGSARDRFPSRSCLGATRVTALQSKMSLSPGK